MDSIGDSTSTELDFQLDLYFLFVRTRPDRTVKNGTTKYDKLLLPHSTEDGDVSYFYSYSYHICVPDGVTNKWAECTNTTCIGSGLTSTHASSNSRRSRLRRHNKQRARQPKKNEVHPPRCQIMICHAASPEYVSPRWKPVAGPPPDSLPSSRPKIQHVQSTS